VVELVNGGMVEVKANFNHHEGKRDGACIGHVADAALADVVLSL
jgi:hypothetical protein